MKIYSIDNLQRADVKLLPDEVVFYCKFILLKEETFKNDPIKAINDNKGVLIIGNRHEIESKMLEWTKGALDSYEQQRSDKR